MVCTCDIRWFNEPYSSHAVREERYPADIWQTLLLRHQISCTALRQSTRSRSLRRTHGTVTGRGAAIAALRRWSAIAVPCVGPCRTEVETVSRHFELTMISSNLPNIYIYIYISINCNCIN